MAARFAVLVALALLALASGCDDLRRMLTPERPAGAGATTTTTVPAEGEVF